MVSFRFAWGFHLLFRLKSTGSPNREKTQELASVECLLPVVNRSWRPILARECSSNARERVAVSFTIIYYINAHLPHAREFSAYVRECITRKLSVASGPAHKSLFDLPTTKVCDPQDSPCFVLVPTANRLPCWSCTPELHDELSISSVAVASLV